MPRPASTKKRKIGVIGTINRDTIYLPGGGSIESWGGLLYTLEYLCRAESVIVQPAVNIGRDHLTPIMKLLGRLKNIDLSLVAEVPERNNHCFLHYANQSHKCEMLKGSVRPLTWNRVKPLLDCDLIAVNFISGPDIKLAALERLRREFSGLIYMDIHSLTLGRKFMHGGFHRFLRRPRQWRRYLACADILQVNEVEFALLAGETFSPEAGKKFIAEDAPHLKCLAVTRGALGSCIIYRRGNKMVSGHVEPIMVRQVYDTTGCGDIFGAGFVTAFLETRNSLTAAAHGNRLAGERCKKKGKMFTL